HRFTANGPALSVEEQAIGACAFSPDARFALAIQLPGALLTARREQPELRVPRRPLAAGPIGGFDLELRAGGEDGFVGRKRPGIENADQIQSHATHEFSRQEPRRGSIPKPRVASACERTLGWTTSNQSSNPERVPQQSVN